MILKQGRYQEFINEIKDKSVDLVLTDPPYWHKKSPGKPYSERNQCNTQSKFSNSATFNNNGEMMKKMSDFTGKDVEELMPHIKRVMKKMNAYIFCNDTLLPYYGMWAENNGYHFSVLIWEKPLSIINKNRFSQHVEYIVRIYEYGTALNRLEENKLYSKVKRYNQVRGKGKLHVAEKPVELLKEIIQVSSNEGDIVADFFTGSCTVGEACLELNRDFIAFEEDEKHFKNAQKRIEKYEK